jgi:hypothetical protein
VYVARDVAAVLGERLDPYEVIRPLQSVRRLRWFLGDDLPRIAVYASKGWSRVAAPVAEEGVARLSERLAQSPSLHISSVLVWTGWIPIVCGAEYEGTRAFIVRVGRELVRVRYPLHTAHEWLDRDEATVPNMALYLEVVRHATLIHEVLRGIGFNFQRFWQQAGTESKRRLLH